MKRWSAIFLIGLALVAGCGSASKPSSTATTKAPTSTTPTTPAPTSTSPATTLDTVPASSPATSAGSSPSSSSPSSSGGAVVTTAGFCSSQQLAAGLDSPNGTAGTIYYQLELRNTSGSSCVVQGYPGVSFVAGSDGHQVGSPASRVAGSMPRVLLAPGRSAEATLAIVDASNYGPPCQLTPVLGLRVYPPDQTAALFVPHTDEACALPQYVTLRIGPLASA